MDLLRGDWHVEAACRGMDPDLFFPATEAEEARAKHVCTACRVRADCLAFAMHRRERHGVWGGTSELERTVMGSGSWEAAGASAG